VEGFIKLVLENSETVLLVVGFSFSVYHNIVNNKEKIKEAHKKIDNLETHTLKHSTNMCKALEIIQAKDAERLSNDESIRRVHERIEKHREALEGVISEVKKEYVSHEYCKAARQVHDQKS
jgi:uncharacterized membrane protein YgaE (UPF0421/DUF939 family)